MKTGGKIVISLVVVGAVGFFMWKYLKKQQTKDIAQCMIPEGENINLDKLIEQMDRFEKGDVKGFEMKRYTDCKNSNKLGVSLF
tara:strand:+ start:1358 stop:1609 length:252 start_codon:yes stop_codon:yes gene_type:complete